MARERKIICPDCGSLYAEAPIDLDAEGDWNCTDCGAEFWLEDCPYDTVS